jgi:hypothetical protein
MMKPVQSCVGLLCLSVIVLLITCLPLSAATISYVDWTAATVGTPGSATGVITLPDLSTVIVTYAGDVASPTQVSGGNQYWALPTPNTYTGGAISNPPPPTDIISFSAGPASINTLTFSRPVTDLVFDVLSVNAANLEFNQPFNVVNSGPGFFGGGTLTAGASVSGAPFGTNFPLLTTGEGNGVIQFSGLTLSSLSFIHTAPEFWAGFTLGIAGAGTPSVPEPSTFLLLGTGLLAAGFWRIRHRGQ